jgi:hypothetical protein
MTKKQQTEPTTGQRRLQRALRLRSTFQDKLHAAFENARKKREAIKREKKRVLIEKDQLSQP